MTKISDCDSSFQSEEIEKRNVLVRYWQITLLIVIICILSVLASLYFEESSPFRDMATGSFAGAVIGLVVLVYEQLREDERELKNFKRERLHEKILRDDADRATDLRELANFARIELLNGLDDFCCGFKKDQNYNSLNRDGFEPRNSMFISRTLMNASILAHRVGDENMKNIIEDLKDSICRDFGRAIEIRKDNQQKLRAINYSGEDWIRKAEADSQKDFLIEKFQEYRDAELPNLISQCYKLATDIVNLAENLLNDPLEELDS